MRERRKLEQEKAEAVKRNVFGTSKFRHDPDPKLHRVLDDEEYEVPPSTRILKINWKKELPRKDSKGVPCFSTPVANTAATLDILENNQYNAEDKLKYVRILVRKSVEQQARAESQKLESSSRYCRIAAGGGPDNTHDSSSHRGKDGDRDPKQKPSPRKRDAESRTGSSRHRDNDQMDHRKVDAAPYNKDDTVPHRNRHNERDNQPRRSRSSVTISHAEAVMSNHAEIMANSHDETGIDLQKE